MIGALLAVITGLAPGIRLADSAPAHRLITFDAALPTLELMTQQQLQIELERLQSSRPGLAAPIIQISVGGVAVIGGLGLLNAGAAIVFSRPALLATFLLTGGAVLLLGGVVLALAGIVKIGRLLAERRVIGVQVEEIEKRLDTLDRLSQHDWVSANTPVLGTF